MPYERPRDIPPEDRYGGGQSYRPGNVRNRSPPRRDRDDGGFHGRSPPRRGPGPPPRGRSRSPLGRELFRRRSPSPRDQRFGVPRGGDSYRARSRSPPPRRDDGPYRREGDAEQRRDPRDDRDFIDGRRFGGDDRGFRDGRGNFQRSPPRNVRDRSPLPFKAGDRDRSPMSARDRRSPLPGRRFSPQRRFDDYPPSRPRSPPRRGFSPRGGSDRDYPSRPRSPLSRNDMSDRANDGWRRPRSPSAGDVRPDRDSDRGRESIATSRRSSPPLHSSRLALIQDHEGQRSGRPSPRSNHGEPQTRTPARSPPRRFASPPKDRDGDTAMIDSAAFRDDRPADTSDRMAIDDEADGKRLPPSGPRDSRAPPTAPRGPAGPAPIPPSGPRGDSTAARGGFSLRGRGSYTTDFTGRGRGAPPTPFQNDRSGVPAYASGSSYDRDTGYASSNPPSGPRNFSGPSPRPGVSRAPSTLSNGRFDSAAEASRNGPVSNSYRRPTDPGSIPLGPASDRSRDLRRVESGVHPALRDLPEVVTNGRKLPPPVDHSRLNKLEEESEKLRKALQEKEIKKRKSLREWDRLVRESDGAAFRSQVAEESLRTYELEAESTGMAF